MNKKIGDMTESELKDFIIELQEELRRCEKANVILDDELTKLQGENEELSRMCELYSKSLYNAELTSANERIDKAIKYIGQELIVYDNESDEYKVGEKLLEILKGEEQ